MDWQRHLLLGGMVVLVFVLIFRWNAFEDQQQALALEAANSSSTEIFDPIESEVPSAETGNQSVAVSGDEIPTVSSDAEAATLAAETPATQARLIHVKTDTLEVWIDRLGGDIVRAQLPNIKVKLGGEEGFTLLNNKSGSYYVARSGLAGRNATDKSGERPLFTSEVSNYTLTESDESINVDLQYQQGDVSITKRFTFKHNDYLIDIRYLIDNQSSDLWQANFYGQIKRDFFKPPVAADSGFGVNPFYGGATSTLEDNYKKFKLGDIADLNADVSKFKREGGWLAFVQHYFVGAWIGNPDELNDFSFKRLNNTDQLLFTYVGPAQQVEAGQSGEITSRFYIGPKDIDKLEEIAPYLDLTIDFGFLWWIAKPLFNFLDWIHSYIGNWGWSIIALTIIIKAIFFYPSAVSYRSMAKMRKLSPKMQDLKERFGEDRQKMSQEMMKLYKTEKVNPMSGCLPILIQMPVFISLYWVLMESVEIRHAPWLLWIEDLSVMDPYFVLPLMMGGSMFIQQKLNPAPPDPMQAKLMQFLPILFTFMFLWFPAGLVIYWVTNNVLSIIQQYIITRQIEKE